VEGKVVRGEGKNRRRVMFRNVEIHYQLLAWCDGGSFRCGGGWRWRLRRRLEGGTRPDNGVLCEDGKFDGESLSSPSPSRTSHCPFNTSREWGEEDGASVHSGPGALGPLTEPCFRAP